MSMRDYPQHGYIVAADKIRHIIPSNKQKMFDEILVNENDNELIGDFIDENVTETLPPFDIYRPSDEDNVDEDMEAGKVYLIFSESDLFEKKPTAANLTMNKLGITAELMNWSVYG